MTTLETVVTAGLLVNASAVVASVTVFRRARPSQTSPRLLSFAIGVLLGTVLLDLLPHLWEATGSWAMVIALFTAALLASRLFDRVCPCRHVEHVDHPHHSTHEHASSGASALLLAGDLAHNLVDGALIAAALAAGVVPGAVATLAVAMHEVPRRVAVVALLVRAGRRPARALWLTAGTGLGTVLGGLLIVWSTNLLEAVLPAVLAITAAATLYAALNRSAHELIGSRVRSLTAELAGPFLAGFLMIEVSHHLLELLT